MTRIMTTRHPIWHTDVVAARWTDEQRTEALELYTEHGAAEAARRTGIPAGTIYSWAHHAGLTGQSSLAQANGRLASVVDRKARLASDLLDDAQALRAQLFAPAVERKAMVVSHGKDIGSSVEVVDIERDQPTFAEQTRIMTSIAIAIDKVQILTGEATERIEHRNLDSIDAEVARLVAALNPQAATVDPPIGTVTGTRSV